MERSELPEIIHFGVIMAGHVAEVHTCPMPEIGPEDVVLKMSICNMCTTDYQQWMGLRDKQGFPMADGHEFSGVICYKGENVSDSFEIGMQVACMARFCGECDECKAGHVSDCTNTDFGAIKDDGYYGERRYADYAVIPQRFLIPIDNSIPPEQAAFLEPVSTVVSCIKRGRVQPGETVVVIGAGTMGLLNAQVAHAFGARVIITEVDDRKLDVARGMGIADVVDSKAGDPVEEVMRLTNGVGADVVIPAVGLTIAYKQGYGMLRQQRGRMVIFPAGYPEPELDIHPNEIHYRKIEIIGTFCQDLDDWYDAAELIGSHKIDVSCSLEGLTYDLKDIQEAYAAASVPGRYRVSVNLQGV